jgi:glutaredoxin
MTVLFAGAALILGGCGKETGKGQPTVTYEELGEANSFEATFSRHKSCFLEKSVAEDESDTAVRAHGLFSTKMYQTPDVFYSDQVFYNEDIPDHRYREEGLRDKTEEYYLSTGDDGEKVLGKAWYVMSDEEKAERRLVNYGSPESFNIILIDTDGNEKVVSTEDNGDGTLTVTTNMPADVCGDCVEVPEEWKDATVEYQYRVNKDNLELYELDAYILSGSERIDFLNEKVTYDVDEPEGYKAFRDYLDQYEKDKSPETRSIKVIYDPGTDMEETYEMTESLSCSIYPRYREGYSRYSDPEGKTPFQTSDGKRDVTVYCIKDVD